MGDAVPFLRLLVGKDGSDSPHGFPGRSRQGGLVDHFELLTGNKHVLIKLTTGAVALSYEVPAMSFRPIRKRPVPLSFNRGELLADLIERNEIHLGRLDHAEWLSCPVGNDTLIPRDR